MSMLLLSIYAANYGFYWLKIAEKRTPSAGHASVSGLSRGVARACQWRGKLPSQPLLTAIVVIIDSPAQGRPGQVATRMEMDRAHR